MKNFCCLLRATLSLYFPLLGFCFLINLPNSWFVICFSSRLVCASLRQRSKKSTGGSRKRCLGFEKKIQGSLQDVAPSQEFHPNNPGILGISQRCLCFFSCQSVVVSIWFLLPLSLAPSFLSSSFLVLLCSVVFGSASARFHCVPHFVVSYCFFYLLLMEILTRRFRVQYHYVLTSLSTTAGAHSIHVVPWFEKIKATGCDLHFVRDLIVARAMFCLWHVLSCRSIVAVAADLRCLARRMDFEIVLTGIRNVWDKLQAVLSGVS